LVAFDESEIMSAEDKNPPETDPVTESLGGIQGSEAQNQKVAASAQVKPGRPLDEPAPDAGEIEWAGGVMKKPPAPERDPG
jgi:hypothetical protein